MLNFLLRYKYGHCRSYERYIAFIVLSGYLILQQSIAYGEKKAAGGADADAIVRKMVITYQSAQSVQEKSEAKMKTIEGREFFQSSEVKFRRPNLLYIASTDPQLGTYTVYCNGRTVTMYTGTQNIFTKRDSPTNLRQTVQSLHDTGNDLLGTPVTQILSPVSFMSANGMPDECKKFHFVKEDTLDGKRVYVVSGQADVNWALSLFTFKEMKFLRRDITLWIDASRSLLLKASCDMIYSYETPVKAGQRINTVVSCLRFTETHSNIALNVPIREETFFFQLPRGAVEKFQERK